MVFSILVPVYNVEKYVRQCLESVLAQDFPDYEIILVNDCSPDNTYAVISDLARNDERNRGARTERVYRDTLQAAFVEAFPCIAMELVTLLHHHAVAPTCHVCRRRQPLVYQFVQIERFVLYHQMAAERVAHAQL